MGKNKIYPKEVKEEARGLRSQGWSLGEISLKMRVPKNTLSVWVKDIRLTENQIKRIKEKEIASAAIGRSLAAKLLRVKIEKWKEGIREKARHFEKLPLQYPEIGKLTCGLLYLCEGGKYPANRQLTFSNSDPRIIKLFIKLLRDYFNINEDKLRCRIMHRWDQDGERLKIFWSEITQIPLNRFYKSYTDKRTRNSPTKKKDYKGICAIQYFDTNLQFELQSIGEAITNGGADGN